MIELAKRIEKVEEYCFSKNCGGRGPRQPGLPVINLGIGASTSPQAPVGDRSLAGHGTASRKPGTSPQGDTGLGAPFQSFIKDTGLPRPQEDGVTIDGLERR